LFFGVVADYAAVIVCSCSSYYFHGHLEDAIHGKSLRSPKMKMMTVLRAFDL